MVLLVTVALHALVIAGLMAVKVVLPPHAPDMITSIDTPVLDPETVAKPPQPTIDSRDPQPRIIDPAFDAPDPQIPVDESTAVSSPVPVESAPAPVGATEGPGTAGVADIPSTPLQFRAVRAADDYYPSASLSLQEEGTAIVRVCVAPSGKLDGKPVIERTSGSTRLDAAALVWAREALTFSPATRGGTPIAACKGFRVTFSLR